MTVIAPFNVVFPASLILFLLFLPTTFAVYIYLQAFNVVLLDSGSGEVGLDGGEDGLEVGEGDALDAESVSAAGSEDGSVGHVAAQSAEDVA